MNLRTVVLSCLAFLAVIILVPRNQWVLRGQLDRLAGGKVGDYAATRRLDRESDATPGRDMVAMQAARTTGNWAEIERIAERDPNNERGLWSYAVRHAVGSLPVDPSRRSPSPAALHLTRVGIPHLKREQDKLFRELMRAVFAKYEGDPQTVNLVLKDLASEVPADRPNLALLYDNGYQDEADQGVAYREAIEGYRGEYARLMIEAGGLFPELVQIRNLAYGENQSPGQKMQTCLVGAHLCRTSNLWIQIIIGRMMLEEALRPGGEPRVTARNDALRQQVQKWAKSLDKQLMGNTAFELAQETDYAALPFPMDLGLDDVEIPFNWGGRALAAVICIFVAAWAAFRWQSKRDEPGMIAALPHLTAAAGWVIANIFLSANSAWMLSLLALSHLAFAAAMASEKLAKGLTGALALLAVILVVLSPDRLQALPGLAFFIGAAALPWLVEREGRRRWGLIAGWAISAGCFLAIVLAPESILPVIGWALGLLSVRNSGKSAILATLCLLGSGAVGAAIVAHYSHESWEGWVFAIVISVMLGLIPGRTEPRKLSIAIGTSMILATVAYGGSVGWALRQDGQMALVRVQFATLGEKMRAGAFTPRP